MKHRLLIGASAGAAAAFGVALALRALLAAAREAIVTAALGSPVEAAFVAVVVGLCAVILVFPFALALGGWVLAGAVWGAVRFSRLVASCLRRPGSGQVLHRPVGSEVAAPPRKAA